MPIGKPEIHSFGNAHFAMDEDWELVSLTSPP